jgi:hypothetical protein
MKNPKIITPAFLSCVLISLCSYTPPTGPKSVVDERTGCDPYDVIIVPGVPYQYASMRSVLKARVLWAKYLYDNCITKNIIFSGSSVYSPYIEGEIMRIYADSLGIPAAHTFAETEAEHSTENIYYSLLMAKEMGFKKIAVATDRYQAAIISNFIKRKCPDIEIVVIEYDKIDLFNAKWPEIDPTSAFVNTFVSLPRRENYLKRFKGTLGKNVPAEDDASYVPSIVSVKGIKKATSLASSMVVNFYNAYAVH